MFYADDSRKCSECNIKLSTRNHTSRKYTFTNLCKRCYGHPPLDKRCHAIKSNGGRCGFRITGESTKLCKLHTSKKE